MVFYFGLWEYLCVTPGDCFHYLVSQPQVVSLQAYAGQYLPEDSREILSKS